MLSVYWVQSPSSNSDSNLSHIPSMTYLNLSPISMSTKPCQPMSTTSSPVLSTYSSALNLMDEEILNSPPTQIQTPIPQSSSQISILNSVFFFFSCCCPFHSAYWEPDYSTSTEYQCHLGSAGKHSHRSWKQYLVDWPDHSRPYYFYSTQSH